MTKEAIISRERSTLLAVYEAAAGFIRDRNKGDFVLPDLAGYDADALEQRLCEASAVIVRDMPPNVVAVHAHIPTP